MCLEKEGEWAAKKFNKSEPVENGIKKKAFHGTRSSR